MRARTRHREKGDLGHYNHSQSYLFNSDHNALACLIINDVLDFGNTIGVIVLFLWCKIFWAGHHRDLSRGSKNMSRYLLFFLGTAKSKSWAIFLLQIESRFGTERNSYFCFEQPGFLFPPTAGGKSASWSSDMVEGEKEDSLALGTFGWLAGLPHLSTHIFS